MLPYYVNLEVKYLLIDESNEKEEVFYADNETPFNLAMIGPRPPFYANPRYEPYFTKI
ncbi:hypothetical protein ACQCT6_08110 [Cytobacillus gottheilii]|uniref:Uncharacterized protein n=1 Tax=Cytobacillus gottheilii TaxID=859144 RepID=A0ABX8FIP5_9BACI|nr:hypothetical protein [Cytobacillus gottheilii]QVY63920.1 hypothetical protein J1899_12780 [Cytobacillus gottheilii]